MQTQRSIAASSLAEIMEDQTAPGARLESVRIHNKPEEIEPSFAPGSTSPALHLHVEPPQSFLPLAVQSPAQLAQDHNKDSPLQHPGSPSGNNAQSPATQDSPASPDRAETVAEVNNGPPDTRDDGYDSASDSDSVSLASEVRNFLFENGRRYHGYRPGAYQFPNDDSEQDREDLKHAVYLKLFQGVLHFAPLRDDGLNVIDLGTGTGIWATDFADTYPSSTVLGVDLSPIQAEWVPPNLKFMVDDVEAEWLHPINHFDYVHTRHTVQAFRDWPLLMRRAFQHIKPGGWLECQEIDHFPRSDDNSLALDNPMVKYWNLISTALQNLGVNMKLAPQLANMMREVGFVNVTERVFFTPIGMWPRNKELREVGLYWRTVLEEGLEAIAYGPFTRGLGWRKEEVDVFLASVRKAYREKATHSYMPFYIIYGQKPPV